MAVNNDRFISFSNNEIEHWNICLSFPFRAADPSVFERSSLLWSPTTPVPLGAPSPAHRARLQSPLPLASSQQAPVLSSTLTLASSVSLTAELHCKPVGLPKSLSFTKGQIAAWRHFPPELCKPCPSAWGCHSHFTPLHLQFFCFSLLCDSE